MLTKYRGLNLQGWKGCRPTCHSEGEEEIKKKKRQCHAESETLLMDTGEVNGRRPMLRHY
jgi:hypothetical protein